MTKLMRLANLQKSISDQLHGIRNGGAHCSTVKISPVEELIHLSLVTMTFCQIFQLSMFAPFAKLMQIENL